MTPRAAPRLADPLRPLLLHPRLPREGVRLYRLARKGHVRRRPCGRAAFGFDGDAHHAQRGRAVDRAAGDDVDRAGTGDLAAVDAGAVKRQRRRGVNRDDVVGVGDDVILSESA